MENIRDKKGQFVAGNEGFWLGKQRSEATKEKLRQALKGRPLSEETKEKRKKSQKRGEESPTWKGDNIGYSGIHMWLRANFGVANWCESVICSRKSRNYNWCKIRGMEYERKRENFIQLCVSCHRHYDKTND